MKKFIESNDGFLAVFMVVVIVLAVLVYCTVIHIERAHERMYQILDAGGGQVDSATWVFSENATAAEVVSWMDKNASKEMRTYKLIFTVVRDPHLPGHYMFKVQKDN